MPKSDARIAQESYLRPCLATRSRTGVTMTTARNLRRVEQEDSTMQPPTIFHCAGCEEVKAQQRVFAWIVLAVVLCLCAAVLLELLHPHSIG